jgi:hypothetical protein
LTGFLTIGDGAISNEFDLEDHREARIEGFETTEYFYSTTGELMRVTLPDCTLISR